MTAYSGNTTAPTPWPGATAQSDFFALLAHVLTQGAGASRPSSLGAGGIWAKSLGGGDYEVYLYNGTSDVMVYSRGDLVGPVSGDGSGGVTGAAMEIDYTASGELVVKFANGLAIVAKKLASLSSGSETWSLPVTFTDTAKMFAFAAPSTVNFARSPAVAINSTSSVTGYNFNADGTAVDTGMYVLVAGFWTEQYT